MTLIIEGGKEVDAASPSSEGIMDLENDIEGLERKRQTMLADFLGSLEIDTVRRMADRKGISLEDVGKAVVDGEITPDEFSDLLMEEPEPDSSRISSEGMRRLSDEYDSFKFFAQEQGLELNDPETAVQFLLERPRENGKKLNREELLSKMPKLINDISDPELRGKLKDILNNIENPEKPKSTSHKLDCGEMVELLNDLEEASEDPDERRRIQETREAIVYGKVLSEDDSRIVFLDDMIVTSQDLHEKQVLEDTRAYLLMNE